MCKHRLYITDMNISILMNMDNCVHSVIDASDVPIAQHVV